MACREAHVTLVLLAEAPVVHPPPVPTYPPTRRDERASITRHGRRFPDPYAWLSDLESPETAQWLAAQESLTRHVLETVSGREELSRVVARASHYERRTRDIRAGPDGRAFWWQAGPDERRLRFVMRRKVGSALETVIDPNGWPPREALAFAVPSPDGCLVAFGVTGEGYGASTRILDVESGTVLDERLYGTDHASVAWRPDSSAFFYSACPEPGDVPAGEEMHWNAIYEHQVGTPGPRRVFGDTAVKECWCGVSVSECGRFAVLTKWDFVNANTVYLLRLADGALLRVTPEMEAVNEVHVLDDRLLIRTDLGAPRGRVCKAVLETPKEWQTLIPEPEEGVLRTVAGIGGRLYAVYARRGAHEVTVFDTSGSFLRTLPLPGTGSVNRNEGSGVVSGVAGTWRGADVWVEFQSFVQPPSTYQYDFENDNLLPLHVPASRIDAAAFVTERDWCRSADGTAVPITVVRHREAQRDGTNFLRLTSYGGFGVSVEPRYTAVNAAWLALGGMLAFAHVRGGGEFGAAWHEAAVKTKRQRAFDDYIAAARHLVAAGYTTTDRLVSRGNSNGGLLVAATALQAPDAFGAVFCRAPVLDMLRFPEFGFLESAKVEYGDPDDPVEGPYLARYSPYHNVEAGVRYPPMTFVAALDDTIAPPHDPAKMAARLQCQGIDGGPFLLLPLRDSGHGGAATLDGLAAQDVNELGACLWMLGIDLRARNGRLRP